MLDHRLLDDEGNIDLGQWEVRRGANLGVGHCTRRGCRGLLTAAGDERMCGVRWLSIVCDTCGHEMLAPDGRLAPRPRALTLR